MEKQGSIQGLMREAMRSCPRTRPITTPVILRLLPGTSNVKQPGQPGSRQDSHHDQHVNRPVISTFHFPCFGSRMSTVCWNDRNPPSWSLGSNCAILASSRHRDSPFPVWLLVSFLFARLSVKWDECQASPWLTMMSFQGSFSPVLDWQTGSMCPGTLHALP